MDIRVKAINIHIAISNLEKKNFPSVIDDVKSSIERMYGKYSSELHEINVLKEDYNFAMQESSLGNGLLTLSKFKIELRNLLQKFYSLEQVKIAAYFTSIREQLNIPEKELDGLKTLQQHLYDSNDPFDWSNTVFEVFKEVYGPQDERTRLVRKNMDSFHYSEEGMPDYDMATKSAFEATEEVIDTLILQSQERINRNKVITSEMEPKTKKGWFDFTSISTNTWGLIISLFIAAVGGAYFLGKEIGGNRFDSEKNSLYQEKLQLQDEIRQLQLKTTEIRDSIKNAIKVPSR